ncbi:MAG: hypothetical protein M0C28_46505 [Candidatus Moduliflexus flocculans]|nr:hypothetical protein [Candidatus Moduliflexus flocculans]
MTDRAIAHEIFAECGGEIFQGLRGEQVFQHIMAGFKNDEDWSFPSLQGKVPPALLSQLATALFEKASAGTVEEAQECLRSLRRVHLQNRLKTIQRDIARSGEGRREGGAPGPPLPETGRHQADPVAPVSGRKRHAMPS